MDTEFLQFVGWMLAIGLAVVLVVAQVQLFGIKRALNEMLTIAQHEHRDCPACRAAAAEAVRPADPDRKICDPE